MYMLHMTDTQTQIFSLYNMLCSLWGTQWMFILEYWLSLQNGTPFAVALISCRLDTSLPLKKMASVFSSELQCRVQKPRYLSLYWKRCIHSTKSHPVSSSPCHVLPSHLRLGLPSGPFSSDISATPLHVLFFRWHVPVASPISSSSSWSS